MRVFERAVSVAGAVLVASAVVVLGPVPGAGAAPNFYLPFPCEQTWDGQTRTDHSPRNAVDLNRPDDVDDPVAASASGKVSKVGTEGGYGNHIVVDHGGGLDTLYAHLKAVRVAEHDLVSPGQLIGNVGSTGNSSGAHLHYEQRSNGNDVRITFNGTPIHYFGERSYTSRNNCAAYNPYTPRVVCGGGQVIDYALLGPLGGNGAVYLLRGSGGRKCVATIKATSQGTPRPTSAYIEIPGAPITQDSGNFTHFAGPAAKIAPGRCVRWGGSVNGVRYDSPFEHCD